MNPNTTNTPGTSPSGSPCGTLPGTAGAGTSGSGSNSGSSPSTSGSSTTPGASTTGQPCPPTAGAGSSSPK
jgi:hypothetical protein